MNKKKTYVSPSITLINIGSACMLATSGTIENQIPDGGAGEMIFNPDGSGIDTGEGGDGWDAGEAW